MKLEKHLEMPVKVTNINKRLQKLSGQKKTKSKKQILTEQRNENVADTFGAMDINSKIVCSKCNTICKGKCPSFEINVGKEKKDENSLHPIQVKLEHVFAEGADMTLTDLILFYCQQSLLVSWYACLCILCFKLYWFCVMEICHIRLYCHTGVVDLILIMCNPV